MTSTQPQPRSLTEPEAEKSRSHGELGSVSESGKTLNQAQRDLDLQYLAQALALARLSPPKPTNFRVGCVIVAAPLPNERGLPGDNSGISQPRVLATGYTLELPGNTHAEQNALAKLAARHNLPEAQVYECPEFQASPNGQGEGGGGVVVTLYTTLEPCAKRLSGNLPCVERIIATRKSGGGVQRIVYGAKEPDTFVHKSTATRVLEEAGIRVDYVGDLEDEILRVAMEGHNTAAAAAAAAAGEGNGKGQAQSQVQTNSQAQAQAQAQTTSSQGQSQSQAQTHGARPSASASASQGTNIDNITPEERRRQEAMPRNPKKRMMEVDVPPRT